MVKNLVLSSFLLGKNLAMFSNVYLPNDSTGSIFDQSKVHL